MTQPPSFHLVARLRQLFPAAVIGDDIEVSADLNGRQCITAWRLSDPQPTDDELAAVVLPEPDLVITDLQARLWLNSVGLYESAVQAHIDSIPDIRAREDARATWNRSLIIHLSHPLVESIGTALGLDAAQLRAAFIAAQSL